MRINIISHKNFETCEKPLTMLNFNFSDITLPDSKVLAIAITNVAVTLRLQHRCDCRRLSKIFERVKNFVAILGYSNSCRIHC